LVITGLFETNANQSPAANRGGKVVVVAGSVVVVVVDEAVGAAVVVVAASVVAVVEDEAVLPHAATSKALAVSMAVRRNMHPPRKT
jgi:hypothetical protein